jgi:hypothetical protein
MSIDRDVFENTSEDELAGLSVLDQVSVRHRLVVLSELFSAYRSAFVR